MLFAERDALIQKFQEAANKFLQPLANHQTVSQHRNKLGNMNAGVIISGAKSLAELPPSHIINDHGQARAKSGDTTEFNEADREGFQTSMLYTSSDT